MRILIAVHQFFPEFHAGTETLARRTAEELQRRGHKVWILTAGPHEPDKQRWRQERWQELELIRFNPPPEASLLTGRVRQSYLRPKLVLGFISLLIQLKPDALHLFHLRRHTVSLVHAARLCGIPLLATLTDYWLACPTGQLQFPEQSPCPGPRADVANCVQHMAIRLASPLGGVPFFFWRVLVLASRLLPKSPISALLHRPRAMADVVASCKFVLVPSRLMWQTFEQLDFNTRRFQLCPYGISLEGLEEAPPRQSWVGPQQRPLRIGYIGSFNRAKGAHVLLEAIALLGPDFPLEAIFYGNPSDDKAYADQLRLLAMPLPQVQWGGVFPSDHVFAILAQLDLLVVPSLWRENAPLIVLQALASGLPMLTSDVDGIKDQVQNGANALLFPPGNSLLLADLIRQFVFKPEELAALSSKGGAPRTLADYADQLELLYSSLPQA